MSTFTKVVPEAIGVEEQSLSVRNPFFEVALVGVAAGERDLALARFVALVPLSFVANSSHGIIVTKDQYSLAVRTTANDLPAKKANIQLEALNRLKEIRRSLERCCHGCLRSTMLTGVVVILCGFVPLMITRLPQTLLISYNICYNNK